jgi:hypothetical protein
MAVTKQIENIIVFLLEEKYSKLNKQKFRLENFYIRKEEIKSIFAFYS